MRRVRQRWIVVEDDAVMHVVPNPDIAPHGFLADDKQSVTLAGADCPCKPDVQIADRDGVFKKPLIGHQSFYDQERIAKSMQQIVGK